MLLQISKTVKACSTEPREELGRRGREVGLRRGGADSRRGVALPEYRQQPLDKHTLRS